MKLSKILMKILFPAGISFSIRYSRLSRPFRFLLEFDQRGKMFKRAAEWAFWTRKSGLDGDYLEFGVFEGCSFATSFYWAKRRGLNSMKFYAFDAFQGLPATKGIDAGFEFTQGQTSCSLERFKNVISRTGVDLSRVIITPGWFNEVLNEETKKMLEIKWAAIVFIDCDLYQSTVPVLDFITDYLVDGSLLMFGEWFHFRGNPDRGQQRATREWLEKNPAIKLIEYHKFSFMGNSFIVHRDE